MDAGDIAGALQTGPAAPPSAPGSAGGRRVAVVTGASSGIGEALARKLARDGWLCVLVARREERLRALSSELGCEFEVCDVGDRSSVARAAAAIVERHPAVHLLVNNAGIPGRASFVSAASEQIDAVTAVNYLGGVWVLRALLPALERATGAAVVNVASVAGTVAVPTSGPYSASKHAQIAFSRAVCAELKPSGIHVVTVMPGFVETEGFPQRGFLPGIMSRLVVDPDYVAEKILRAVKRRRRELVTPGWYRIAGLSQWLMPWLLHRIMSTRFMLSRESF